MEITSLIWLLIGMKSIEGQWVVVLHSSGWHMWDQSGSAGLKVLFELWGTLLFTKDGKEQIMVTDMNIYLP